MPIPGLCIKNSAIITLGFIVILYITAVPAFLFPENEIIAYVVLLIMGMYTGAFKYLLDKYGSILFEESEDRIPDNVNLTISKNS